MLLFFPHCLHRQLNYFLHSVPPVRSDAMMLNSCRSDAEVMLRVDVDVMSCGTCGDLMRCRVM